MIGVDNCDFHAYGLNPLLSFIEFEFKLLEPLEYGLPVDLDLDLSLRLSNRTLESLF